VKNKKTLINLVLIILPLLILGISLFAGRYPKPLFMPLTVLSSDELRRNWFSIYGCRA
jgi:hypothetical protein